MATLGNRVGEQQWDVYDKAEVDSKIVELAPSEIDDNAATTTNTWSASKINTDIATKQDTLISGTNIKTINGGSVLGSGDLAVGSSMPVINRTTNTILDVSNKSTYINITSGTFTQTFSSAVTLGNGWFCYIRNSGTGDITLDPNLTETIDGLTSFIMYPNEVRLVKSDGTNLISTIIAPFYKTFTTSETFVKPSGYSLLSVELWGGGASGGAYPSTTITAYGGGGGGYTIGLLLSGNVSSSVSVIVGAGGAKVNSGQYGLNGGDSSFGSSLLACGALASGANNAGGFGFRNTVVNLTNTPFAVGIGNSTQTSLQPVLYGGASTASYTYGAKTIFGGAGGASTGSSVIYPAGTTMFGGSGGSGGTNINGTDGGIPAGGGGGINQTASTYFGGAGGRGEVRIWGVI